MDPNGPMHFPLEGLFLNMHPPPGILTGLEAVCEVVSYPAA